MIVLTLTLNLSELNIFVKLALIKPARGAPNRRDVMAQKAQIRAATALALLTLATPAFAEETLNALVWCDHTDPALVAPFEKKFNVKVNLKEYEGTAAGMAILDQSQPGDWDVLVIDAVDVHRAVEAEKLAELPADKLPTADFFPELVMAANNTVGGKTFAVTEKFGYNTISYDKTKVDPKDMDDLATRTSGKYDGKIGIYDYYLPVLGLVALGQGISTADIHRSAIPYVLIQLVALVIVSLIPQLSTWLPSVLYPTAGGP